MTKTIGIEKSSSIFTEEYRFDLSEVKKDINEFGKEVLEFAIANEWF